MSYPIPGHPGYSLDRADVLDEVVTVLSNGARILHQKFEKCLCGSGRMYVMCEVIGTQAYIDKSGKPHGAWLAKKLFYDRERQQAIAQEASAIIESLGNGLTGHPNADVGGGIIVVDVECPRDVKLKVCSTGNKQSKPHRAWITVEGRIRVWIELRVVLIWSYYELRTESQEASTAPIHTTGVKALSQYAQKFGLGPLGLPRPLFYQPRVGPRWSSGSGDSLHEEFGASPSLPVASTWSPTPPQRGAAILHDSEAWENVPIAGVDRPSRSYRDQF